LRRSRGMRGLLTRRPIIRMADPSHYTPGHRIWEYKEVDKSKRGGLGGGMAERRGRLRRTIGDYRDRA